MSSLKDIMDVDVEPLESQAYRRRAVAQQQASSSSSHPTITNPSSPSPPIDDSNKGKTPINRRKSHRVSKPAGSSTPARQHIARRPSSAGGETMDFTGFQAGGSSQASMSGSPQQSPRGSDSMTDLPVKYTPVTGRLSRAKKGVPVHPCDICRPVKTFTRAEHLRRHQLSHQKPAYPCTFEDCERAFHRPDLLARHLHRHETQGEKPYKAGDPRSRASSSASESRTPSLKMEPPPLASSSSSTAGAQTSSIDPMAPRTSGSDGSSLTTSSYSTITNDFQAVNFQGSAGSKRTHSQAQLSDTNTYPVTSPGPGPSSRPSGTFDYPMGDQNNFSSSAQSALEEPFENQMNYTTTPQLPLLRIPDNDWNPGLTYTNSPWCSSASSTYSTQSDASRNPPQLAYNRGRSLSVATQPDWSATTPATFWTHGMTLTPSEGRGQGGMVDAMFDNYETPFSSPRISTPVSARAQLLSIPTPGDGYYMEPSVGTPTLPTYSKPLAQRLSASTPRFSNNSGMEIFRGKKEELVESQQLGSFALNTMPTLQSQPSLDMYLSSYWQSFHQTFPIIHEPTFDVSQNHLLTSAMAAIGTQYHDTTEARIKGSKLNEECKKGIELYPTWDLPTMQAILLTEIFTRFRGRKTTVKIWRPFEEVYTRLLSETDQNQVPMPMQSPAVAPSAEALMDRFGPQPNSRVLQPDDSSDWYQWIDREARQRLLSACFMFDVHQFMYHQQSRSRASRDKIRSLICLPCPDNLWNATTPTEEWQSQRSDYIPQPLHILEHSLASDLIINTSPFTQSLITCWFAARLPPREDTRYPTNFLPGSIPPDVQTLMNVFPTSPQTLTYLALHHTPLHSLLAVAGDTWVFSQKITPPSEFHDAQYRLKTWCMSFAAAQATYQACQVLSQALMQPIVRAADGRGKKCFYISDYWSLYTCALICWAFGHKYQNPINQPMSRSNSGSDVSAINVDALSLSEETRLKALSYTSAILDMSVEDLWTNKTIANTKGDTCGVIDAIRYRLELESIGKQSGHLLDAVVVLTKIKKGIRQKWF